MYHVPSSRHSCGPRFSAKRKESCRCKQHDERLGLKLPGRSNNLNFPTSNFQSLLGASVNDPIHTSGCEASPGSMGDFDEAQAQVPNFQVPAPSSRRPAFRRFPSSSFPASHGVVGAACRALAHSSSRFQLPDPPCAATRSWVQVPKISVSQRPTRKHQG